MKEKMEKTMSIQRSGQFLGIFTGYSGTSVTVARGVNDGNIEYSRAIIPHAINPGDTLSINVPPGQDPGLIPAEIYFPTVTPYASPTGPQLYGGGVQVVSHDNILGITVVKCIASGTVTGGDEILLEYIGGE
jgi:hypothetical protein